MTKKKQRKCAKRSVAVVVDKVNRSRVGTFQQKPRAVLLASPQMWYHVKFGSSATNGVRINTREPPKLGSTGAPPSWGGSVADHLKTSPLPICVTTSNLVVMSPFTCSKIHGWNCARSVWQLLQHSIRLWRWRVGESGLKAFNKLIDNPRITNEQRSVAGERAHCACDWRWYMKRCVGLDTQRKLVTTSWPHSSTPPLIHASR